MREKGQTEVAKTLETPVFSRGIEILTEKLKFDRRIAFRVYDEFTDNITEDTQGNLYVQVNLPDNEILYSYLLSFAEYVEVLEPQCIRKQIKKRLQKMQEKYIT